MSDLDAIKFLLDGSYRGAESKFKNQIKSLKQENEILKNRVADLEAKLAESQHESQEFISKYRYWRGECAVLEKKLETLKNKNPRPKLIKKTLSITSELNQQAEDLGINFSHTLREALKKEIKQLKELNDE